MNQFFGNFLSHYSCFVFCELSRRCFGRGSPIHQAGRRWTCRACTIHHTGRWSTRGVRSVHGATGKRGTVVCTWLVECRTIIVVYV